MTIPDEIVGQLIEIGPELPTTIMNRRGSTYQTLKFRDINAPRISVYTLYLASDVESSWKFKRFKVNDVLQGLLTSYKDGKKYILTSSEPHTVERLAPNGDKNILFDDSW